MYHNAFFTPRRTTNLWQQLHEIRYRRFDIPDRRPRPAEYKPHLEYVGKLLAQVVSRTSPIRQATQAPQNGGLDVLWLVPHSL